MTKETQRTRGFEPIKTVENDPTINLPIRATKRSAGYDFEASEDVTIPSMWASILQKKVCKPTLVPTGIKAYMPEDEYLQLTNRSSNPLKQFLLLANGVGVIDADYYSNPDNDGHIMFQFLNFGIRDKVIKQGERIGQGIFLPFYKADNDQTDAERTGGFGSSGK